MNRREKEPRQKVFTTKPTTNFQEVQNDNKLPRHRKESSKGGKAHTTDQSAGVEGLDLFCEDVNALAFLDLTIVSFIFDFSLFQNVEFTDTKIESMMTGQGSDETPFSPTQRAHNRTVLLKRVFSDRDMDVGPAPLAPRRKASLVDNRVAEFELHFAKKREAMAAKLSQSQREDRSIAVSSDDSMSGMSPSQHEAERSRSALRKRQEEEDLMREVHKSLGIGNSSWNDYAKDGVVVGSPSQNFRYPMPIDHMNSPPPPPMVHAPMESPALSVKSLYSGLTTTASPSASTRSTKSSKSSIRSCESSGPGHFQDSFAATHQKALNKIRKQRVQAEEKRKAAIMEEARLLKLQAELLEQQALGEITEEEMKTKIYDKADDDIDAQFGEMKLRGDNDRKKSSGRSSGSRGRSPGRSRSKSKDKYSTRSSSKDKDKKRHRSKSRGKEELRNSRHNDGSLRTSRHKDGLRSSRHSTTSMFSEKNRGDITKSPSRHRGDKSPSKSRGGKSPGKHRGDQSPSKHRGDKSPSKHRDKSPSKSNRDQSPSKFGHAKDRARRERERSRSAGRMSSRTLLDGDDHSTSRVSSSASVSAPKRSRSAGRLSSRSIGTTDSGEGDSTPPSSSRSIMSNLTSASSDSCGMDGKRRLRSRSSGALKGKERVKSKSMMVMKSPTSTSSVSSPGTPTKYKRKSKSFVMPASSTHSSKSTNHFSHPDTVLEGEELLAGEPSTPSKEKKRSRSRSRDNKKERVRTRSKDSKKEKRRSKSMVVLSTNEEEQEEAKEGKDLLGYLESGEGEMALAEDDSRSVSARKMSRSIADMSYFQLEVQGDKAETAGTKVLEALSTPSQSKRKGNKFLSPLMAGKRKDKKKDKKETKLNDFY